jgi:hypothetical protein
MVHPNWFDLKYQSFMVNMTPEACLSLLATDPRIVQAVKDAFADIEHTGPNKAQALRQAVCAAMNLQAPGQ